MAQASSEQSNTVISVATIAADLHRVMHIAWSVSIAAKNAMIISAQAGEQARSFQPITRFIDEIAHTTIDSTQQVERESIRLTRLSAYYLRCRDASLRFRRVQTNGRWSISARHVCRNSRTSWHCNCADWVSSCRSWT